MKIRIDFVSKLFNKLKTRFLNFDVRNKKLILTSVSSLGTKFITVIVSLISLPLTYNYLDSERFGVMVTIVSLLGTLNFLDFGLGFGLQNRWPEYDKDDNGTTGKKAISSVFFFLVFIGIALLIFAFITYHFIDLSKIFYLKNPKNTLIEETRNATTVFFLITAITFPFTIVQKVQIGSQEGYITNSWIGIANICSLIFLILFTYLKLSIGFIVFALYGITNGFVIINFIVFFFYQNKEYIPNWNFFELSYIKKSLYDGLVYLVQQFSSTLLLLSNNILLAKYCGAEVVGDYNIGFKLMTLFLIPMEATSPYLLPAYNDALEKNELSWIQKTLKMYLWMSFIYALLIFLGIFLGGGFIIKIWMNRSGLLNYYDLLSFGVLASSTVFIFYSSYIMLSKRFIFISLKIYPIAVIVSICLKWVLVNKFQMQGINYAQTIGLTLFFLIPSLYILYKNKYLK